MADPEQEDRMDEILERFGEVQGEYAQLGGYELEALAREVLHGLGFADEQVDGPFADLSGGWRMRVSIAKVLIGSTDVLLLDEPTNHLDIESILWLEQFLQGTDSTLLMTCHDRDFMNRVVRRVVEIDSGELVSYSGDYDFYDAQRAVRAKQQEASFARQQKMLEKEERFIERFEKHAAKAAQVQSRAKKLEKIERLEPPKKRVLVPFRLGEAPRSGNDVATLAGVEKRYGDYVVYDGLDLELKRGERWCVMGVNGAGKSTLLKLIAGAVDADGGAVRLGATASDTCDDWRSDAMTDEGIGTFMPRALYFEQLTPCDIFGAVLCVRTTLACETDACRCGDGVLSGSETDADCGGSECSACRPGQECRVASDCADGVCDSGRCAAPTCSDGVRNGGETDLDCGGVCGSCPAGDTCAVAADCASGVCDLETSTCVAASCDDGVANGLETDVDCGASSACGRCANGRRCDAPGDCDSGACTAWAPGRAMRCGTTFGHLVHLTMELDGAPQPVAREVIGEGAFLSAETGTLRVGFWPFPEDGRHDVLLMPQVVSIIAALEAEARARGRTLETGAGPGYRMTDPETDVYVFPAKDDSLYDEVTDLGERYARPPVVNAFTARGGVVLYMDLFANSGDDPSRNTYAEMASLFEDCALRSSTPPSTEPSFLASLDRDFGPQLPDMAPVCTPTTQSTHPLAVSPARLEAPSMRFSGRGQRWVLDVVRSAAPSSFGDDWHEVNVTLADEEGFALVTHFLRSSGS